MAWPSFPPTQGREAPGPGPGRDRGRGPGKLCTLCMHKARQRVQSGAGAARLNAVSGGYDVEEIDAASASVLSYNDRGDGGEPRALRCAQADDQVGDLGLEGCVRLVDNFSAFRRDDHVNAAAVDHGGCALHEASLDGAVDEFGHARLVQLQETGQLLNCRLPVSKNPEQAGLRDR